MSGVKSKLLPTESPRSVEAIEYRRANPTSKVWRFRWPIRTLVDFPQDYRAFPFSGGGLVRDVTTTYDNPT